jgi:hypothetical protein
LSELEFNLIPSDPDENHKFEVAKYIDVRVYLDHAWGVETDGWEHPPYHVSEYEVGRIELIDGEYSFGDEETDTVVESLRERSGALEQMIVKAFDEEAFTDG